MSEIPLRGGDVNIGEKVVVRVGDTVRRPQSDRAAAVHALLRHLDLASAANYWVPLRPDDQAAAWGLPTRDRTSRLRLLCDAYGLDDGERAGLLDVVAHRNQLGYESHDRLGRVERRPGWRETWDTGGGAEILARIAWFEEQRDDLLAFLR